MSIFNNKSAMFILAESARLDGQSFLENDTTFADFEDTLKGLDRKEMCYTIDSLPIMKDDCCCCGEEGCSKEESCCKESYLIEYDILSKLIESSSDIQDEFAAHNAICEHYGWDSDQLGVVFATADVLKESKNYELMDSYTSTMSAMMERGIKCYCKK